MGQRSYHSIKSLNIDCESYHSNYTTSNSSRIDKAWHLIPAWTDSNTGDTDFRDSFYYFSQTGYIHWRNTHTLMHSMETWEDSFAFAKTFRVFTRTNLVSSPRSVIQNYLLFIKQSLYQLCYLQYDEHTPHNWYRRSNRETVLHKIDMVKTATTHWVYLFFGYKLEVKCSP